MTISAIGIGTSANDRTGDAQRAAYTKINDNFAELDLRSFPSNFTSAGLVGGSVASLTGHDFQKISGEAATVSPATGSRDGWRREYEFGGSTLTGARQSFNVVATFTAASSASNANRNYVASVASMNAKASDGGTDLTTGVKGSFFAQNLNARAYAGAVNLASVVGSEADVFMEAGSSARGRFGYNAVSYGAVNATFDAAFVASSSGAATASWKCAFMVGKTFWGAVPPVTNTGTIIGTDGSNFTIGTGVDLSSLTMAYFLKGPSGFSVDGNGKIAGADLSGYTLTCDGSIIPL